MGCTSGYLTVKPFCANTGKQSNGNITTKWINPFHANVPFLYPLKTFSEGMEIGHWREKG